MGIDIDLFLTILEKEVQDYAVPIVELLAAQTDDPYRILLATILSSRTRDQTTARAARRLFARAPDPAGLARLSTAQIAQLIYPVGFYKNKAAQLARLAPLLLKQFNGRVPAALDSLLQLPGVGRKTANLVLTAAFHQPALAVDTHVHRIMNLWGYVRTKTPPATEMALRAKLPAQYWPRLNFLLVAFGQATCKPRRPHCDRCPLTGPCPKIGVTPRRIPKSLRNSV